MQKDSTTNGNCINGWFDSVDDIKLAIEKNVLKNDKSITYRYFNIKFEPADSFHRFGHYGFLDGKYVDKYCNLVFGCHEGWFSTLEEVKSSIDGYWKKKELEEDCVDAFDKLIGLYFETVVEKKNHKRHDFLSEMTDLKVTCRNEKGKGDFYEFSNESCMIFSCFGYGKAKVFAEGYVAGKRAKN